MRSNTGLKWVKQKYTDQKYSRVWLTLHSVGLPWAKPTLPWKLIDRVVFLCLFVLHLAGINYDGITIYSKTSGTTKVTYSILVKSVVSNTFSLIFLRWARSSRTRAYGNLVKLINSDGFVRKSIFLEIKSHIKRYHCYLSW